MTEADMNDLRVQIEAQKKRLEEIKQEQSVINGTLPPGEKPEIVAKAIKNGDPIPLKYIHSFDGLRELYKYSLISQDIQIYEWVIHQTKMILGDRALVAFQKFVPPGTKLPTPEMTPRRTLLKQMKKHSVSTLSSIAARAPKDSFWEKQLMRIITANNMLKTVEKSEKIRPVSAILAFSFLNSSKIKRGTPIHPYSLINQLKINPIVYVPSLIEAFAPEMNWNEIHENEFFYKRVAFVKKCTIPPELCAKKLKQESAPQDFVNLVLSQ